MSDARWSDDRVTALSKLWLDGLSASQIAKQLGGVTRNAVIGKVHRLGLSGRGALSAPSRPARISTPVARAPRRTSLVPTRRPLLPAVVVAPAEGPGLVDNLVSLDAHRCKWPIGDPKSADFSFCGRPADGRYCAGHERVGVRPGTALRADRDPVVRRALAGLI
ncbi:MAG: GcrA cell cycle regulator [Caulobacteraceae bacterium]|nr:GcrA cell cycle regulator [Caulobacteraceae bacterium]